MRYGLEEQVIQEIYRVLLHFPKIKKVVIYGSRAKGNYKAGSDIDLCLFGEGLDLPFLHTVELALDDLFLPYSFDLSAYSQLKNQDLIAHIDRCGTTFFEKTSVE